VLNGFPDAPWRYAVVPLPVVPMAGLAVAALLFLRETDELQRRIQLEALGFAFAAGSLVIARVFGLRIEDVFSDDESPGRCGLRGARPQRSVAWRSCPASPRTRSTPGRSPTPRPAR
jgi:hypothetical protein